MQSAKPDWKPVKDFTLGDLVVRVTRLEGFRPRYSLELCRVAHVTKFARHIGVFVDDRDGVCELRSSIASEIHALIVAAESWILEQAQKREDEITKGKGR